MSKIDITNMTAEERKQLADELLATVTVPKAPSSYNTKNMTKQQIIDLTWELPELPDNYVDVLNENGFLTGAAGYLDDPDPVDYDWVVMLPPHVFSAFSLEPKDDGYWEDDGFTSIYAHKAGKLYNILCISRKDLFDAWLITTATMRDLYNCSIKHPWISDAIQPFKEAFSTKWKRVRVFRALRDVLIEHAPRKEPMEPALALRLRACKICHEEAANFSCAAAHRHYIETSVGECCSGETY